MPSLAAEKKKIQTTQTQPPLKLQEQEQLQQVQQCRELALQDMVPMTRTTWDHLEESQFPVNLVTPALVSLMIEET
jgi:hypothetical protein